MLYLEVFSLLSGDEIGASIDEEQKHIGLYRVAQK
jgi:hypothetical protein